MMVSLWWVTYPNGRWSKCELVSFLWVTYPKRKIMVSLWWVTYPDEMMVSLWWVTYPEKWWSHCYGWPTQMKDGGLIMMGDILRCKMMVSLWWVTYPDGRWCLIMMGDLPRWRVKGGLIIMGDLPKCKDFFKKNSLIVTGYLPRWKNVIYLAKRLSRQSPDMIRLTNGASWLQGWFEDSSWWQGWSPRFFEILLLAGFISFSSHSRI
jgi:hypothetical protein